MIGTAHQRTAQTNRGRYGSDGSQRQARESPEGTEEGQEKESQVQTRQHRLMEFLAKIWEFLTKLPPWCIIAEYEGAVKLRWGTYQETLEPGFHWRMWLRDEVLTCAIKEQIVDIASQVVCGTAVETTIRYEVDDPRLALLEVIDYDDSIANYTLGLIGRRLAIEPNILPQKLRRDVLDDLRIEAKDWGVNVIDLQIPTFTKARTYRLLND